MRRDRDGGNGSAGEIAPAQAHRLVDGTVVVAAIDRLDLDRGEPGLIEEMAGELAAGARKVGTFLRMARHGAPDPDLRPEDQADESDDADGDENHLPDAELFLLGRRPKACLAWMLIT